MTRITRAVRCTECGRPTGEEVEVSVERKAPPPGICAACAALEEPGQEPDSSQSPYACSNCGSTNLHLERRAVYEWDGTGEDGELVYYLDTRATEINVELEKVLCGECGQPYHGPFTVTYEPATEGRD